MATYTDQQSEVLHSKTHSVLSSEEIAKAVARHNKHHPADTTGDASAKARNAPAKAKSGAKP
jgi:hypothetical protein